MAHRNEDKSHVLTQNKKHKHMASKPIASHVLELDTNTQLMSKLINCVFTPDSTQPVKTKLRATAQDKI